jgi:hypothetical protein
MRLSNDRDQALIRSAVSDAAANLLSFIPSLGTREVFTFGAGVALPTRMRFQELAAAQRPSSEASGNTRADGGVTMNRDLLSSVIERWRSATMSHRMSDDVVFDDFGSSVEPPAAPPLQPQMAPPAPPKTPAAAPAARPGVYAQPLTPTARPEGLRSSLLKKPLDSLGTTPPSNTPYPPRFR